MKRFLAAALYFAGTLAAATCPSGIPVVTIPPQQVAGFVWGPAIQPMGDACVESIAVDPAQRTPMVRRRDEGAVHDA